MKKALQFSAANAWLILVCLLVITALAATQLKYLKVHISAESLAVEDDPAWIAYKESVIDFDDSNISVVLIRDPQLFTTTKLVVIKEIEDALSDIPEIIRVTSLFNVANIKMDGDFVSTKAFLETIPSSQQALDEILEQARLNPLVIDNIISEDGQAFAINLTFKNAENDPQFDQKVSAAIENVLSNYRDQFDQLLQIGSPFIRATITEKIGEDQIAIMPWAIGILIFSLALGIRSLSGAFIPLFTASISVILTLSGMAMLDIPISVMTSIVPALLVIIGSTEDIHIIADYKYNRLQGLDTPAALERTSNSIGTAILLTFITTYFGFISIYTNEIRLLQEFGLVASTGLLINYLVTTLSVPAILKLIPHRNIPAQSKEEIGLNIFQKFALFMFHKVQQYSKSTVLILVLILVIAFYGMLSVKINNNPLGYFKQDTDVVQNAQSLRDNLSGIQTFSIILKTGIEDTFKKVRYLEEIEEIEQYLNSNQHFEKSLSFNDFLKLINVVMEEDEIDQIDQLYLPDADELVRDYLLFVKHDLFKSYVTPDYSAARILVRHSIHDSSDLRQAIDELQRFIDDNTDAAIDVSVTGASIVRANGADYMAAGQAKSLMLMSLVIIAVVAILFVNWKAGMVALLPNLFPIVVLFGVMGWTGITLDTGTAMVAVIALGISVDDTVHFMTRYHHNTRNRNDPEAALKDTVMDESVPIITTSLALMAGFAALSLSSFVPIENFGLLSALVMLLALMTTFIITPLLLTKISLVTMWDMLSLKLQAQVVDDCPLFEGLSPWQIKQAILSSDIKYFEQDDIIITQGSIGDEMYVILEGQVSVKMTQPDGSVATVNEISEGGLFGEIALISQVPRVANVIANRNTRLLAIRWNSIRQFARFYPRIAALLFQNLASIAGKRLAKTDTMTILRDEYSGAVNRTFFKEIVNWEAERCQRYKEPLTFICFTLLVNLHDKEFNSLLKQLSAKVKGGTRKIDIYARWGGQRFVILLPRTHKGHAQNIAGRVEQHMMKLLSCYQTEQCLRMTIWSYDGEESIESLMNRSEQILNAPIPEVN